MKSQEARKQRARNLTRREEERKMREEEEERLRSGNLGVESILLKDNDGCFARREQIKVVQPNQTQPNPTKPNQTQPNPTKPNPTQPNRI